MSGVRINLLFGFLGSGKTTLVRRILSERGGERPMAVIVNEFGEVGVDGEVIAGNNVNLVELTSGCLCCTLRGSLMSAVEELREKAAVEQIVVEATGVASPGDMLEDLNDSKLAGELDVGPLVTVIDAPKFTRLQEMLGEFYEEQVENADVLVLNKIDLATQEELDQARAAVREINPDAVLLFAERGDTDLALLLDGPESELLAQMKAEAGGHPHDGQGQGAKSRATVTVRVRDRATGRPRPRAIARATATIPTTTMGATTMMAAITATLMPTRRPSRSSWMHWGSSRAQIWPVRSPRCPGTSGDRRGFSPSTVSRACSSSRWGSSRSAARRHASVPTSW